MQEMNCKEYENFGVCFTYFFGYKVLLLNLDISYAANMKECNQIH